jgi:hypothetical protein
MANAPGEGGMARSLKDDLPDVTSKKGCGRLARRANQAKPVKN